MTNVLTVSVHVITLLNFRALEHYQLNFVSEVLRGARKSDPGKKVHCWFYFPLKLARQYQSPLRGDMKH